MFTFPLQKWYLVSSVLVALFLVARLTSGSPIVGYEDSQTSETGHKHHKAKGRVHIKVYRGPGDHHFAPWGYWLKQPEDEKHHHKH
ncbi:UNVERIFIED_CONTAM: hypothetical protein RMT77_009720 [Armadillidium vulgare]